MNTSLLLHNFLKLPWTNELDPSIHYLPDISLSMFFLLRLHFHEKEKLHIFLFSFNIRTLIGLYSASFMMQNFMAGVMKTSTHSRNNTRDITIVFTLIFIIYILFGIFGSFAFAGLYQGRSDINKLPNTILDLISNKNTFLNSWEYIIIGIMLALVFLQILT